MPDLNKSMMEMQDKVVKAREDLRVLLDQYDSLFREANTAFLDERVASGSTDGMGDFYRCVQTLRRNRDVLGSLVRGFLSIRPVDKFKFVEEDIEKAAAQKPKPRKTQVPVDVDAELAQEIVAQDIITEIEHPEPLNA